MSDFIQNTIQLLNSARIGSFSEYVFESVFKSDSLFRKHSERTDFVLNGISIDIKSKRYLTRKYIKTGHYSGKRYDNIEYILIEYYNDCVIISRNRECLKKLDYFEIEQLYRDWLINRSSKIYKRMKISDNALNEIKEKISSFFTLKGYNARVLYRTSQDEWGKESPGNLLPKKVNDESVTVLILFKENMIETNNIKEIIAFRDIEGLNFTKIEKPQLHVEKVDLELIEKKYKYSSIEDLINHWK